MGNNVSKMMYLIDVWLLVSAETICEENDWNKLIHMIIIPNDYLLSNSNDYSRLKHHNSPSLTFTFHSHL